MKVYVKGLRCPACNGFITEPLSRYSGPIAYVHKVDRRPGCRLIILPDPFGHRHLVRRVPDRVSLESALEVEVRKHRKEAA